MKIEQDGNGESHRFENFQDGAKTSDVTPVEFDFYSSNDREKAILDKLSNIEMKIDAATRSNNSVPDDSTSDIKWKWRQVALILDRIFMFIYVFLISISVFILTPRPA